MRYYDIEEINEGIARDPQAFAAMAEGEYDDKVEYAARHVLDSVEKKPIILLSGPSGSGKTTTAERIKELLLRWGHPSHTISLDNYFFRREDGKMPLDEYGNVDLESPKILDVALLREHFKKIVLGKPIDVPIFDFAGQKRSDVSIPLHAQEGEIVIFEGIHALNPEVVGECFDYSTGIYVSVRTRLTARGMILHPEKIRLMRRLIRDMRTRGQSYKETAERLYSVSRGEQLYIMPHKFRADIDIDTFIPYEAAVYKSIILPQLTELGDEFIKECGLYDVKSVLEDIEGVDLSFVPEDSLIREFIG